MFGHYGMPMGMFWDSTYILVIIGALIGMAASVKLNRTFSKYSKVRSMSGMTAAEVAEKILRNSGISDVIVERIPGNLTDHYDPRSKVVRLSDMTYGSNSVAAIGVAAHECGHALQDADNYVPMKLRSLVVPAANIGSMLSMPIVIAGIIFSIKPLIMAGILLFTAVVIFQLVTLPVEINASTRAVRILGDFGILRNEELSGTKKVLTAAALTYVAATVSSLLMLLRLLILSGILGGKRND